MHLDTCGIERNGLNLDAHDLLLLQFSKHAIDNAGFGPAIHARVDRVPVAIALGKGAPLAAVLGDKKDRVDQL